MLLNLQMVMHEPWKASAPEVYLLTTTDGSVPRGLDPNRLRKGLHVYFQFSALRFAKFGRERELEMPSYAQPIYRQISLANKILSSGGGGRVLSNY